LAGSDNVLPNSAYQSQVNLPSVREHPIPTGGGPLWSPDAEIELENLIPSKKSDGTDVKGKGKAVIRSPVTFTFSMDAGHGPSSSSSAGPPPCVYSVVSCRLWILLRLLFKIDVYSGMQHHDHQFEMEGEEDHEMPIKGDIKMRNNVTGMGASTSLRRNASGASTVYYASYDNVDSGV
jgi:hypothetical protein